MESTTGIFLGTAYDRQYVLDAATAVGFDVENKTGAGDPLHTEVGRLRLQVHIPCYMDDLGDIVTEMEFDDFTGRFPGNPEAVDVLRRLYEQLPDLVYREHFWDYNNRPEARPLSELLERL